LDRSGLIATFEDPRIWSLGPVVFVGPGRSDGSAEIEGQIRCLRWLGTTTQRRIKWLHFLLESSAFATSLFALDIHPPILAQMDSFTAFLANNEPASSGPIDKEHNGGGGAAYCVIAREETVDSPVDQDNEKGGGAAYCIVA
jgi:hypothetical protein